MREDRKITKPSFDKESPYKTELDKLESLMMDASAVEYNQIGEKVTYEAVVQVQTENSVKTIHELTIAVNRNSHVLCEIKQFSHVKVDKASAVREIIAIFQKYARICRISKNDFVIYNDPDDLKSISINKVTHNDRAKKILGVDHDGIERVIEYKEVIGVEDETGVTLKDWRGLYLIFDKKHPAIVRSIKKD